MQKKGEGRVRYKSIRRSQILMSGKMSFKKKFHVPEKDSVSFPEHMSYLSDARESLTRSEIS